MYLDEEELDLYSCIGGSGYDFVFSKSKSFLRHVAIGQVKQIGFYVNNLYKIEVESSVALSSKVGDVKSWDVREL